MTIEAEEFLERERARRLDALLELDLDWRPARIRRGRLVPSRVERPLPALHLFRRSRAKLASVGLGAGTAALRAAPARLRGELLVALGWPEAARREISSIPGWSRDPRLREAAAKAALGAADPETALELLEGKTADPWRLAWRSEARRALGDRRGALQDLARARAAAPEDGDLLLLEARLGSRRSLEQAKERGADAFWTAALSGLENMRERRAAAAVDDFTAAAELDPRCAWALVWRALARERAGDRRGAAEDREKAIILDPAAVWSYAGIAERGGMILDWIAVLRDMEARVSRDPRDAVALALRAECRDQHELVVRDLKAAVERDGSRAWLRVLLARVLVYDGEVDAAMEQIGRAIARRPACGWFYSWRGEIWRRKERWSEALADQEKAVALSGGLDARALAWRGSIKRVKGDLSGALADLDASLELDTEYASWVLAERSRVHSALKNKLAARTDLEEAARRDPRIELKRPRAGTALGWLALAEKRLSRGALDKALALDPRLPWAYAVSAELAMRAGRWRLAADDLAVFRSLSVKDCGSTLYRSCALRRSGLTKEALELCSRLVDHNPSDAWAYQARALCRLDCGDPDGALADQRLAQRFDARRPWVFGHEKRVLRRGEDRLAWAEREMESLPAFWRLAWTGHLRLLAGRAAQAEGFLKKALALDRKNPWALAWLAEAALSRGGAQQALEIFSRGVFSRSWMLALRGEASARLGRAAPARADFARALRLDPAERVALLGRARLLQAEGKAGAALALLDRALGSEPPSAWLHHWRGELLLALGRAREAEAEAGRALALHAGYAQAAYLRGEARRRLKRLAEALRDLDRAIALDPRRAEFFVSRGLVRGAQGRAKDQIADFGRACDLDPERFGALRAAL